MSFKYLLLHKNILINITKILEYLDYRVTFWNKDLSKVCETIYQQEEKFIRFPLLFIAYYYQILDTFEIIALLLKAGIICSNFLVNFCLGQSRYSMKSHFFNISFIAIDSNSLKKKPIKQSSLAAFGKKMNKTPKNVQNDQISRIFGILRQNVGRKNT